MVGAVFGGARAGRANSGVAAIATFRIGNLSRTRRCGRFNNLWRKLLSGCHSIFSDHRNIALRSRSGHDRRITWNGGLHNPRVIDWILGPVGLLPRRRDTSSGVRGGDRWLRHFESLRSTWFYRRLCTSDECQSTGTYFRNYRWNFCAGYQLWQWNT